MNRVVNMFKNHSVCVTGVKGSGKDLLFGNVIARINKPYVSNVDYGGTCFDLSFKALDMGANTYDDFINDTLKSFSYPYPKGADIYISDVGVYLPSQYCNELNKKYPYFPSYFAFSRQISRNRIHFNTQSLNRCWDKLREQSDFYIRCNWCFYLFGLVIQSVTVYDKAESCQSRVRPCRARLPLFATSDQKLNYAMYMDNFYNSHGTVKDLLLIYFNKSKHDTYLFEKKLNVRYTYEDSI